LPTLSGYWIHRENQLTGKPDYSDMKKLVLSSLLIATLAALSPGSILAADAAEGQIDFGKFTPSKSSGQFVEVNVQSNLISMVARLAESSEPEIASIIRGLKSVRVNVIGLGDDNRTEVQDRVQGIRKELTGKGWERIVAAQSESEDVGVFLKLRGDEAVEGIVVTVLQGQREAVLINIVGDIRPEKLSVIGERFNIEPLKRIGGTLAHK
jgi:hypothetical protein